MPRRARLDFPGLLHHVIARGIERRVIFRDKIDYEDFVSRLEISLQKEPNQVLAWALMPNHLHLLVRSGAGGLTALMRRLMTGYATAFNRRHRRAGYLFQNRYKSIVCDEENYLLELVRYIHLNPLRAGIVKSLEALRVYPWTGHSALMGTVSRPWQETGEILGRFGGSQAQYHGFVHAAKDQGRRPELVGGGLTRSLGGMENVLRDRRERDLESADERILGVGTFVEDVLREAKAVLDAPSILRRKGIDLRAVTRQVAEFAGISERSLFVKGRTEAVSRAKAMLIYVGVNGFNKTTRAMAEAAKMSLPAASKARGRGERLWNESPLKGLFTVKGSP